MNKNSKTIEEALNDADREEYYRDYTKAMLQAVIEDSVDVKGYFPWSMRIVVLLVARDSHHSCRSFGQFWMVSSVLRGHMLTIIRALKGGGLHTVRFGVTYVDYKKQKRYPKYSAKFLKEVRLCTNVRWISSLSILFPVVFFTYLISKTAFGGLYE